jgi:hypothetical protein
MNIEKCRCYSDFEIFLVGSSLINQIVFYKLFLVLYSSEMLRLIERVL